MKYFGKCYKHGLKDLKETTAVEGSDFLEAEKDFTEKVKFNISLYEYKGVGIKEQGVCQCTEA